MKSYHSMAIKEIKKIIEIATVMQMRMTFTYRVLVGAPNHCKGKEKIKRKWPV